jgi:uncharacterized protein (DUF2235 family)
VVGSYAYGAIGKGVFQAARHAWQQIAANYQDGDKLFIFGFSRGAYAARHLAGMIVRHGLHGWQGTIEETFRHWLANAGKPCLLVRQEVHFLGLFDCVPGNYLYRWRDRSHRLNTNQLEPGIQHVRHAVSVNERRWSFRPLIFKPSERHASFAQHWFPGFHSDVGGGDNVAYKGMKPDDMKAIADSLRENVASELRAAGYEIVDKPGPNVMYVRMAVGDLMLQKRKRPILAYTPVGPWSTRRKTC